MRVLFDRISLPLLQIVIPSSKNSSLPILFASLIPSGKTVLNEIPIDLPDIISTISLLRAVGAVVKVEGRRVFIERPLELGKSRALIGAGQRTRYSSLLLSILGNSEQFVRMPWPGGCNIDRPLDFHFHALRDLGYYFCITSTSIYARKSGFRRPETTLPFPSVGATLNLLLAATIQRQQFTIYNAACEPEIIDTVEFLNNCGASITYEGNRIFNIHPCGALSATQHQPIPDRIVAGTYLTIALIKGRDVELINVTDVIERELCLMSAVCRSELLSTGSGRFLIRGTAWNAPSSINVTASTYPGFPTDLLPLLTVLCTFLEGESTLTDTVMPQRLKPLSALTSLGAHIETSGNSLRIFGQGTGSREPADSCAILCNDIRTGAALLLYASNHFKLVEIGHSEQIERGYGNIDRFVNHLGGRISSNGKDAFSTATQHSGT